MTDIATEAYLAGVALQNLAAYVGVSRSSFTEKVTAGKLSAGDEAKAKEILTVMSAIQRETGFPVAWDQVAVIKPKLEQKIAEYRESLNPTPTFVYVVRLSSFAYFRCVRAGEIVTTPSLGNCVMTESREVAQQIVNALQKNFKTKAAYESFTNTICRRADTMCTSVSNIGINE
jgi:hypothetical protein